MTASSTRRITLHRERAEVFNVSDIPDNFTTNATFSVNKRPASKYYRIEE